MLDPNLLTDPSPKVTGILAVSALAADYVHAYGRAALRPMLPHTSDEGLDLVIEQINEMLDKAEQLHRDAKAPEVAEEDRDEWIGYARQAARSFISHDALLAAA